MVEHSPGRAENGHELRPDQGPTAGRTGASDQHAHDDVLAVEGAPGIGRTYQTPSMPAG
jgi:hypothetical protein